MRDIRAYPSLSDHGFPALPALIIGALFLLALGGYSFFQFRALIGGPELSVSAPADGTRITAPLIEIRGSAHNMSTLTLNGRKIFVDGAGRFSEKLLLPYGYTIITVTATDSFGRTETRTHRVVYK